MMDRAEVCDLVKKTICSDRNDTHGNPEDSFQDIATMWSIYLDRDLSKEDVAVMMILLKICRFMDGKPVLDHMVDVAGYAAIAAEFISEYADNCSD